MAIGPGAGVPMPFDLPLLSRGFAEITPAARALGARVAAGAARSLSELLGREVAIAARALPGASPARSPTARVALDLPALPARAALEIEPSLVVRLVALLAGSSEQRAAATALTPVESSALELFALCAIEGACSIPEVEEALTPRLDRGPVEVPSPLGVELDVRVAPRDGKDSSDAIVGRARLLLPALAVRALRGPPTADGPAARMPLRASLRTGAARIAEEELDALAPGDVVVLDPLERGRSSLALPGGLRAIGRVEDAAFHVEETTMTDRHSQLPVEIEVELARFDMPLSELARLEVGSVVSIPADRRGLVVLRAGDREVARGELVDVEGAIAVRVISIEVVP